jgi:hypothetical protein
MKIDELVRNASANIHDLHLALAGLPKNMKVKAHSDTGVSKRPLMSFAHAQHGRRVWW